MHTINSDAAAPTTNANGFLNLSDMPRLQSVALIGASRKVTVVNRITLTTVRCAGALHKRLILHEPRGLIEG